jgi:GTPase SAR1 family protein
MIIRLMVIGDMAVGKSSLIYKCCDANVDIINFLPTIGKLNILLFAFYF